MEDGPDNLILRLMTKWNQWKYFKKQRTSRSPKRLECAIGLNIIKVWMEFQTYKGNTLSYACNTLMGGTTSQNPYYSKLVEKKQCHLYFINCYQLNLPQRLWSSYTKDNLEKYQQLGAIGKPIFTTLEQQERKLGIKVNEEENQMSEEYTSEHSLNQQVISVQDDWQKNKTD